MFVKEVKQSNIQMI